MKHLKKFNESLKSRKGFSKIVVDDQEFNYTISITKDSIDLIVYDSDDKKYEIRKIDSLNIPKSEFISKGGSPVWKGKHGDGAWGKKPVAWVIKNKILYES